MLKDSQKETLSLIGRFGAMAAAAFITLAVAGTSLILGFTITTFADTGSTQHHHCQEMDCEECLLINPNQYPDCEICNPQNTNNNKGLKPEIIGIIGAVASIAIGAPFVIFLVQRRKETAEILVKKEEY